MKRLAFAAIALALSAITPRVDAQDLGIQVGKRAPEATVQDMNGKSVNLGAYIGKTPVLLEFWATWCENCRHLEPALLAAQRKYGKRVRFVGVAVSVNQSPERVKLYAAKHRLKHQIVFDNTGAATEAYDVPATSYIVVVNKMGKVVYTGLGGDQDLDAALKRAL